MSTSQRLVVVAGATSASGRAVCSALTASGTHVVAVGHDPGKLAGLRSHVDTIDTWLCDVADASDVEGLARGIHDEFGAIDGLVNLVGGWRGSHGITGQSDDDWQFLETSLTALRLLSRAFYDDFVASREGRLVIVSSEAVDAPTAGSASYAALKAAAETWVRAVAEGFERDSKQASAHVLVVGSLAGLESRLAEAIVELWPSAPADSAPADSAKGDGARFTRRHLSSS